MKWREGETISWSSFDGGRRVDEKVQQKPSSSAGSESKESLASLLAGAREFDDLQTEREQVIAVSASSFVREERREKGD